MSLQDEEADRHCRIGLAQHRMIARKELIQRDEVAQRLTHLLAVDGDHVVVHPVVNHVIALRSDSLCDLTLMVREDQVHATTVNVKVIAQVFLTHSRTFAMPAGEAITPRRGPAHDVFRLGTFPKREIDRIVLLILTVECTGRIQHVVDVPAGEHPIIMILVVFLHIKINRTLADIGIAIVQNLLHQLDLFDDVSAGVRFDAGRQHVQRLHRMMVTVQIVLYHLHRLQLFQTCLLGDLVFALVSIVLQVSYIRDVPDVTYFIS